MPKLIDQPPEALLRLTHRFERIERAEALQRRPGRRSSQPECVVIGHHWQDDPHRDGGLICHVCLAVRLP